MKMLRETLLADVAPERQEETIESIRQRVIAAGAKIVVLDDDPTGTQTVHDVTVVTAWPQETLLTVFQEPEPVVYLLTNSRSLPRQQAKELNKEIVGALRQASAATSRPFVVVSRSDSTLRGHYPAEVDALQQALEEPVDGVLIIPYFLEGGRYTLNNTHYVQDAEWWVPASETEYARDATFGYDHSDLTKWVAEKHAGQIAPDQIASISLEDIRLGGKEVVRAKLLTLDDAQVCVVNAIAYADLEVFVSALLDAETQGKRFIYRTAASFVRVRGGIQPQPLLSANDLAQDGGRAGGLIIAGSYVGKTTLQIKALQHQADLVSVELSVPDLLSSENGQVEIDRTAKEIERALSQRRNALLYTSRKLVTDDDQDKALEIGRRVSAGVIRVIKGVSTRPAWIIAKGGITSSDVATQGLGVRQAHVLGQAIPGVPIWRLDTESRWPGLTYVVFPGNVGGEEALADMVRILSN